MAQLSPRLQRRFEYVMEILDICRDVEASLYIIASRYAAIDSHSPQTFVQRYAIIANTTPALDIIYRLSPTLQRFAGIYFNENHALAKKAQTFNIMKPAFHSICHTICLHWIQSMVYDDLDVNLQRTAHY